MPTEGTRHKTLLEKYKAAVRDGNYAFPLSELMGFHLIAVEPGHAEIELEARDHHFNPMGTLHGGVLSTIAEIGSIE